MNKSKITINVPAGVDYEICLVNKEAKQVGTVTTEKKKDKQQNSAKRIIGSAELANYLVSLGYIKDLRGVSPDKTKFYFDKNESVSKAAQEYNLGTELLEKEKTTTEEFAEFNDVSEIENS